MGPTENTPLEHEETQEAISDGYSNAFNDLIQNRGFSPRKARRYLDSIAKKNYKKFMKGRKS